MPIYITGKNCVTGYFIVEPILQMGEVLAVSAFVKRKIIAGNNQSKCGALNKNISSASIRIL